MYVVRRTEGNSYRNGKLCKSFSFYTMSPQIYLLFFSSSSLYFFFKVFFLFFRTLYNLKHTHTYTHSLFFFFKKLLFAFLSLFDFFFIKYLLILIKKTNINRTSMSFYDLCYARRHYVSILEYRSITMSRSISYPSWCCLLLRVGFYISSLYHMADLPVTDINLNFSVK